MKWNKISLQIGGNWDGNIDGVKINLMYPEVLKDAYPEVFDSVEAIRKEIDILEQKLKAADLIHEKTERDFITFKELPTKGRWK